jgi:hypothetical protein
MSALESEYHEGRRFARWTFSNRTRTSEENLRKFSFQLLKNHDGDFLSPDVGPKKIFASLQAHKDGTCKVGVSPGI